MSDVKLLPCPFCGGDAHIKRYGNAGQSTQYECGSCGCRQETGEEFNIGSRWNDRACIEADRKALQEEVERLSRACRHEHIVAEDALSRAERLAEALRSVLALLKSWHEDLPEHVGDKEQPVIDAARAALQEASHD